MKNWFLLLSLVAVASALPSSKPTNCPSKCECKEIFPNILDVVGCKGVLTINSTLFDPLPIENITVVCFSNVIIDQIHEDAFKRFPILEDVIIEKSKIGSIDQKAFSNVTKVKFSDCGFEDSPNLYGNLTELHFGNCRLDEIPDLTHLFSLIFLNLSGNYIRDVSITSFAQLFFLEELILSNNEISRMPADIFVDNAELNSLHLDNNPLKTFYLNTPNKLETLSLRNCFLSTFDERSTQHLDSLNELILSNNRINSLTLKDLAPMSQLAVIDLSNNSLRSMDNDIFSENSKLQKVTLDGNKFEVLPNFTLSNGEPFQVYTFSCKNCGLKTVHKNTFKNMPAMISLNLAQNNFTVVQDMFTYIRSLRMLDMSYNYISLLAPEAFDGNRNLETLNVAGNPLMKLNPEVFANTKAIKKIDASDCSLLKLWTNHSTQLRSLRKLLLANNHLTNLSIADFEILPGLQAIDLHNNPLKFNDELCRVINYLEDESVYPVEYIDRKAQAEESLADDIDNFTSNQWSEFHENQCPENNIDDRGDLKDEDLEDKKDELSALKTPSDETEDDDIDDDNYDDDDFDDSFEDNDDTESEDTDGKINADIVPDENINLARASYILSITSVFVLTALAVLIIAVTITLCILRRNNNFNMHKANLPRFKIPLWETQLSQKKHSGSVYRPLSEDLSGPRTPKVSRYEFSAAPTVHSTTHS